MLHKTFNGIIAVLLVFTHTLPAFAQLKAVATTSIVADSVARVLGQRGQVVALMGEGVDPHLYKASPGDVNLLSRADIVFYNGLHLEGKMTDVLEKLAKRVSVVSLTDRVPVAKLRKPPEMEGNYDPHLWFDVSLWASTVDTIEDALIAKDPEGKDVYRGNAQTFRDQLKNLDNWVRSEIQKIPESSRWLITAHDAFGYFGRAYGVEVRGIQGISTDSEASIKEMNALVDLLVKHRIKAVFVESSVPEKTIRSLVEGAASLEHEVKIGGELFSDALGQRGTEAGTYEGMIRHNLNLIVGALQ